MFKFDPNGEVAKIALEHINAVNTNYPDLMAETSSMAFMMASIEKAVLAEMDPMDYLIALSLSWTFVVGMQKNIALAAMIDSQTPPQTTPPPSTPPHAPDVIVIVPCAPGVH